VEAQTGDAHVGETANDAVWRKVYFIGLQCFMGMTDTLPAWSSIILCKC
jgi:hypothetical protein